MRATELSTLKYTSQQLIYDSELATIYPLAVTRVAARCIISPVTSHSNTNGHWRPLLSISMEGDGRLLRVYRALGGYMLGAGLGAYALMAETNAVRDCELLEKSISRRSI